MTRLTSSPSPFAVKMQAMAAGIISQGKDAVRDLKQQVTQDREKTWSEFIAAWDAHDIDRISAVFAHDASFSIVPLGVGAEGQAGIKACFEFFRGAGHDSFPNLKRERLTLTVGHDTVVDESLFTWSHSAVAHEVLPGVTPTNKQLSVVKVSIVSFVDADPTKVLSGVRIKSFRTYFDTGSLAAQLAGGKEPPLPLALPSNDCLPQLKERIAAANAAASQGQGQGQGQGK